MPAMVESRRGVNSAEGSAGAVLAGDGLVFALIAFRDLSVTAGGQPGKSNLWDAFPFPNHVFRPEYRTFCADSLIAPVTLALDMNTAAQAHTQAAAHAIFHRHQAAAAGPPCQFGTCLKHSPRAAAQEQKPFFGVSFEIFLKWACDVARVAARAVFRCQHSVSYPGSKILRSHKIQPGSRAEEKPLADACLGKRLGG